VHFLTTHDEHTGWRTDHAPQPVNRSLSIDWNSPQTRILIGLMAPALVTGMNSHMFNVALPTIRQDFALDADMTAWVAMSYTLAFMTFMPLYGRLGDTLGKQRLLLFGTLLFVAGTIIVVSATRPATLMAGMLVQGIGTAGYVPLCIAIITQRFAPDERGKALGAWNSMIPLAGLSFPFVAGLLVDRFGWRAIYPPILLAAIIAFVMIRQYVQPLHSAIDFAFLRAFDWVGVVLLSAGLATLLLYTSSRPITGVPALQDMRLLVVWLLLFGAWIVWERRRRNPYIDLAIFANASFSNSSVVAGLRMSLMTSISFLIPLYMSEIHGSPAKMIGIVLTVQAGMLFATSRAGGQLADHYGSRLPVTMSMAGLIGIMVLLACLPAWAPLWLIFLAAMGHGLLIGLSLAPLHRSAMSKVEAAEVGTAAGVYSMIRFAGQILGTAVAGVLLQRGLEQFAEPIEAYQAVFWIFAAVAVVATVGASLLRDG
jgi:MFS family permease